MRVGIFLGYNPGTVLAKEGLGRYLGNLIKNILNTGNSVTIACPEWLLWPLDDLFGDFHIDNKSVDFIVEKRIPVFWKLYSLFTRKRKRKSIKFADKSVMLLTDLFMNIALSITSFVGLIFVGLICLLLGIILLPFFLIGIILYGCILLCKKLKRGSSSKLQQILDYVSSVYTRCGKTGMNIYLQLYNELLERVHFRLVKKINRNNDVDVWYSPAVFWPAFNSIHAPRVINVPDLVTEEFALKWGEHKEILYSTKLCEKTIDGGNNFIVYSDYVRDNVVIGKFGKPKDSVVTIPHSVNDLSKYITIDSGVASTMGLVDVFTTAYCKNILQTLPPHARGINDYIRGYDLSDVDYIFYPTQARPHKNIMNLVKAYEYLLRRKYVRVKLFLTCNLDTIPEVKEYMIDHRLQYDIISFYDVTVSGLAALYHQAKLVVNPTLYEGGFPFTFGEGMSVGCPSVMSRIPQVCEMTDRFEFDDILFDPYDVNDIVSKIEYGLQNREKLIEKEQKLYSWMKETYCPEKIGASYVQVFQDIVKKSS